MFNEDCGGAWTSPAADNCSIFAARLEAHGDNLAVVTDDGQRLSYRELAARADAIGAKLGPGRRLVMIEASNALDPLLWLLASLRRGDVALLVPGDARDKADRIAEAYLPDVRVFRESGTWRADIGPVDPKRRLHEDLAVLLTTSGTTGAVKLVRLSRAAVQANADAVGQYLGITCAERPILSLPLHYSYGLSVVTSHLSKGAALLMTERSVLDQGFWRLFEAEGATSMAGVPYTYELLERAGFRGKALPSLRTLTQAGGRLPVEAAERMALWAKDRGVKFYVMYGQTEATARMSFVPPERLLDSLDSIGAPIPGGSFRLIDEAGRVVDGPDLVGELVYRGPNVMMGYALSAADLRRGHEVEELRTGDLARRGGDGLYRVVGRKSRFSKLFGLRISFDELEGALQRQGLRAAVTGDDATLVVALFGAGRRQQQKAETLVRELGLPPSAFEVIAMAEPPVLASGKIDYPALLSAAKARGPAPGAPAAGGVEAAFEHAFPGLWLTDRDSFISLGGDSLSYVSLSLELEALIGALPHGWERLTLGELKAMVPSRPPSRGWLAWREIETEAVFRALAIVGVVAFHALPGSPISGGASVLMVLAGYSLSRYHGARLGQGEGWRALAGYLRRVVAPYLLILAGYFALKQEIDVPTLLLLRTSYAAKSLLEPYWFIGSLLQCMALIVLLCAVPAVRGLVRRDPWTFGLALLAAALAAKVAVFGLLQRGLMGNATPDATLYLVALGWCLHRADTPLRKLLLTGAGLALTAVLVVGHERLWPAYPGPNNLSHAAWLATAMGAILWLPRLRLPGPLQAGIGAVAGASFYIYLIHPGPVHVLTRFLDPAQPWAAILASVAIGVVVSRVVQNPWLGRLTELRLTPRPVA